MRPRISLVITTYNWPEALALVLAGVRAQTRLPDEVLIADDGSGDATRTLVVRAQDDFPVPLRHVWGPDVGYRLNTSRNRGIVAAHGDYVILLDGDMVPHRALVADHVPVIRRGQYVQGTRVMLEEAPTRRAFATGRVDVHWWTAGIRSRANTLRLPWLSARYRGPQGPLNRTRGAHLAFWRDDALAVNGFDEDFRSYGRCDSEFVARLVNRGIVRRNLKFAALAYHLHHRGGGAPADENHQRVLRAVRERLTWVANGADQHIPHRASLDQLAP
ncbi:MAG: glycosyltransferase family 2 protein [Gemmatimonadaceae bacterium]|jgi:glycosyltransferase involved in cell wall biosynthesis|nr:glycosyltransferase family 2 protein [Gemmatimonadaceae bacterium]